MHKTVCNNAQDLLVSQLHFELMCPPAEAQSGIEQVLYSYN